MQQRRKRLSRRMRDEIMSLREELRTECLECFEMNKICGLDHAEFDCTEADCEECKFLVGNCNPHNHCAGSLDPVLIARARIKSYNWMTV